MTTRTRRALLLGLMAVGLGAMVPPAFARSARRRGVFVRPSRVPTRRAIRIPSLRGGDARVRRINRDRAVRETGVLDRAKSSAALRSRSDALAVNRETRRIAADQARRAQQSDLRSRREADRIRRREFLELLVKERR